MEKDTNLFESLLESVTEYGKTTWQLGRLQAIEKATDVASSLVTHTIVIVLIFTFLFLSNLGLALWLGGILENIWHGFFIVAGFYGIIAIILHFFFHDWLKKQFRDFFIKQIFN